MLDFIIDNKEWLFSGVGIPVLIWIFKFLNKNRQNSNYNPLIDSNIGLEGKEEILKKDNDKEEYGEVCEEINPIKRLARKFILVYKEHGISIEQIPSFVDNRFDIKFSDLKSENLLINKMSDELIDWTCQKFGIRRKWFDNKSDYIYETIDCYKNSEFKYTIFKLIDEIGVYDYKSKIRVYAFKDFKYLKANKTDDNGSVLFIIQVYVGETRSKENIYKYIIVRNNLRWDYWRSRRYAKKIIAICEELNINISGYDLDKKDFIDLGSGKLFPYRIISQHMKSTWYPVYYIVHNEMVDQLENYDLDDDLKSEFEFYKRSINEFIVKQKEDFLKKINKNKKRKGTVT